MRAWVFTVGIVVVIAGFLISRGVRPAAKRSHESSDRSARSAQNLPGPHFRGVIEDVHDRSGAGVDPLHKSTPPGPDPSGKNGGAVRKSIDDLLKELREIQRRPEGKFGGDGTTLTAAILDQIAEREVEALPLIRERIYSDGEMLEFREALIRSLREMKGDAAVRSLLEILQASTMPQPLRSEALAGLRAVATTPVRRGWIFDSVRTVLDSDPAFQGRYQLVVVMGETGDPRAVPVLTQLMDAGKDLEVRYHSARALERFVGYPEARSALQKTIEADADVQMRRNAIIALSGDTTQETRIFWEQRLERETEPAHRDLIRRALKEKFGVDR